LNGRHLILIQIIIGKHSLNIHIVLAKLCSGKIIRVFGESKFL
jgi:hypothetical protein